MGEGLGLSQLHLGVHAASLQDMWAVAKAKSLNALAATWVFQPLWTQNPWNKSAAKTPHFFLRLKVGQNANDTTRAHLQAI